MIPIKEVKNCFDFFNGYHFFIAIFDDIFFIQKKKKYVNKRRNEYEY